MTRILEVQTPQASAFKTLIEAMKDILNEANFIFTPPEKDKKTGEIIEDTGGIRVMAMNRKETIFVHLKLPATKFSTFKCTKKKLAIGINLEYFHKIIKKVGADQDVLTLYLDDEDTNKFGISIENGTKNCQSDCKLKLLDIDNEDFDIPATEIDCWVSMPSTDFQKVCKDMNNIASEIVISNVKKQLIFSCEGQYANDTTIFREDGKGIKIGGMDDDDESIIRGKYRLEDLLLFTKCTGLCKHIYLYMKNNYPLVVKYTIANLGSVQFCLSPKQDDPDMIPDDSDSESDIDVSDDE